MRLWLKETFVSGTFKGGVREWWVRYRATDEADVPEGTKWRPSIFMPRQLSRITLEVTAVRVERLQDITDNDAMAEGISEDDVLRIGALWARDAFKALWDSINGKRAAWVSNPWVAVVTFRRLP
jgi:hypothetical protein